MLVFIIDKRACIILIIVTAIWLLSSCKIFNAKVNNNVAVDKIEHREVEIDKNAYEIPVRTANPVTIDDLKNNEFFSIEFLADVEGILSPKVINAILRGSKPDMTLIQKENMNLLIDIMKTMYTKSPQEFDRMNLFDSYMSTENNILIRECKNSDYTDICIYNIRKKFIATLDVKK